MKKIKYILLLLCISLQGKANAKGQQYAYATFNDYRQNKPICLSESTTGKTNVHVHHFFWNMPTVTVICNGTKHTYKKSELYAYTDDKHNIYRFYKNEEFLLAEAGNICIYTQQKNITQSKGFVVVNSYYFSTTPDSKIMELNVANLRAAYANNEHFIALLDLYLGNGSVHQYDNQHKMYKINYIFQISLDK